MSTQALVVFAEDFILLLQAAMGLPEAFIGIKSDRLWMGTHLVGF